MIVVQAEDFDVGRELEKLSDGNHTIGGVSCFVGLVRDMAGDSPITAMTLEHYPEMTEKALAEIEAEARDRW
ncbi:MAG: molybdenum cofactor biosynthesis protein MoaE, partial [Alphaproteobacteria bacterium]|nr:molybdenum cofactor biosynthesis protein MoaE [Alphaproteobacteria bacterium]